MQVHKPADVLDAQVQLLNWWRSKIGMIYGESYIKTFTREDRPIGNLPLYSFMSDRLEKALPYFMTAEMVDRLWAFSKDHSTDGVQSDDLPTKNGFIWLDKIIYILDINGQMLGIRAMCWSEERGGVLVSEFTDKHDEFDEVNLQFKNVMTQEAELALAHMQPIPYLTPLNSSSMSHAPRIDPDTGRHLNNPSLEQIKVAKSEGIAVLRFILTMWEFMGEQLPYRARPDRAGLRRIRRSTIQASEVLVVDLRATKNPSEELPVDHHAVDWSHRWRVRSHKRRWIDKAGVVRETTVRACIKGPVEKPIWEKDVVFNVRR